MLTLFLSFPNSDLSSQFAGVPVKPPSVISSQGIITTVAGSTPVYRPLPSNPLSAPLAQVQSVDWTTSNTWFVDSYLNILVALNNSTGQLSVVAGNGIAGYSGDGGPTTLAQLNQPNLVRVNPVTHNVLIADSGNSRIRRVANGVITTAVGTGVPGRSGDGGPPLNAQIGYVTGMTFDASGALYFSDNQSVRKVNTPPTGGSTVITVSPANVPFQSISGIAFDNSTGNILVCDQSLNQVFRFKPGGAVSVVAGTGSSGFSGDGGPAAQAKLSKPAGIWVEGGGNAFVADVGNNRVRQISPAGVITTFAGNSAIPLYYGDGGPAAAAGLVGLLDVAIIEDTALLIADSNYVRYVDAHTGIITTIAGSGTFAYGGDGGPATSALIGFSLAPALDSAGNLYIPDLSNNRIRKVDTNGVISTILGNGASTSTGDGGPAANATVFAPSGVAVDATGNIYVSDGGGQRIRKIAPSGAISTIAGSGKTGYSGDGGQATSAALNFPGLVSLDAQGNVYFVDYVNSVIRKVTPAGVISTVAGNGQTSSSGDNGPATSAGMTPFGLAVSASGTIYIADQDAKSIRQVTNGKITTLVTTGNGAPQGIALDAAGDVLACLKTPGNGGANSSIAYRAPDGTTGIIAGGGPRGFSGDGGPALNAQMKCSGVAVDAAGNVYIADGDNIRIRKVSAVAPTVSVTPATLNFTAVEGNSPAPQTIQVSGTAGIVVQAAVSTVSGGTWLNVSPAGGQVPAALAVTVNSQTLTAGSYQGSAVIQIGTLSSTVNVQLTITPVPAGVLAVSPSQLSLQAGVGSPASQTITIANTGGTTLTWTAKTATINGGGWLSVSPPQGSSMLHAPSVVSVTANAQGLTPGVYYGSVTVTPPAPQAALTTAVQFVVTSSAMPVLSLSQSGLSLIGPAGGIAVGPSVFVQDTGAGAVPLNWTANVVSGTWLNVSPTSGSTSPFARNPPPLQIQGNATGLQAGVYYGLIQVSSPGSVNSPQYVNVVLQVTAGGTKAANVYPQGMIFASSGSGPGLASQQVSVATSSASAVQAAVSVQTLSGTGNWLSTDQNALQLAPVASLRINADPSKQTPGVYQGVVTFVFSDGSPAQDVTVYLVVPASSGVNEQSVHAPAATCTPAKLIMAVRQLSNNFLSNAAWPVNLEAQLLDDCGNLPLSATAIASFSNGDAPLALVSLGNGIYSATWKPLAASSSTTVTIQAFQSPLKPAIATITGSVAANPAPPPLVPPGGVVNGASFAPGADLAPGAIVSIFGTNLATSDGNLAGFPLPTTLAGIKLTIGGIDAPLFYSGKSQVNAQVPFEVTPGSQAQVVARAINGAGVEIDGVPEPIAIGPAHPGIFLAPSTAAPNQGAILSASNVLIDAKNPASVGDTIVVYCTGLGATNPPATTGQAAAAGQAAITPTVTIGGIPSTNVQYAGPSPGYVGLYQVNVAIPTGVTPGPLVPVVISQRGVASNSATIAVH